MFAAAGLILTVRNHAMGGTGSITSAYCSAAVYGDDLDAVSWDFGMTDGRNDDHAEFFFRQAILQNYKGHQNKGSPSPPPPVMAPSSSLPFLPPLLLLTHNSDTPREAIMSHYSHHGFEVAGIRMNHVREPWLFAHEELSMN